MFLLVPAHPGFPGQIPQSRKTVVCVCVYQLNLGYLVFQISNCNCYYTATTTILRPLDFGTTRVSRYQKGKTKLDLMEQEIVSGSGISWAICKSALRPRQITTQASHHSVFYRPDVLPATQPTMSKH